MAGMRLNTGVTGSVVGNLYGGYNGAAVPAASSVPEGPGTITQQAWGVPSASNGTNIGFHAAAIGTLALVALGVLWWMLPRLGDRIMRITLPGIVVGIGLYWAFQHFTGMGNTGKAKG